MDEQNTFSKGNLPIDGDKTQEFSDRLLDKEELPYILASQFAVPGCHIGEFTYSPKLASDGARNLERHLQTEFLDHYGFEPCSSSSFFNTEMSSEYSYAKGILAHLNDKRLPLSDAQEYSNLSEDEFKQSFKLHFFLVKD